MGSPPQILVFDNQGEHFPINVSYLQQEREIMVTHPLPHELIHAVFHMLRTLF